MAVNSKGNSIFRAGSEFKTTNNRMEVAAIREALTDVLDYESRTKRKLKRVILVSDSGYATFPFIKYGWLEKWKHNRIDKDIPNYDLWSEVIPLVLKLFASGKRLEIYQIRGHGKDKRCDYAKRDCFTCSSFGCSNPLHQYMNALVDDKAVNARLKADGVI